MTYAAALPVSFAKDAFCHVLVLKTKYFAQADERD